MVKQQASKDEQSSSATDQELGRVALVGAGPGTPELLTRRAWKRLQNADVVLYDSLTTDAIIDSLPQAVEAIDVGKRSPNRRTQHEINRLMRDRAQMGDNVVRLKGGDPNVFGRGGEEAEYLAGAEISFEVVPGISSVLAVSSVSGIPLTHRDYASSLMVITGHQDPTKDESAIDWTAVANTLTAGGTVVILMGVNTLSENVAMLKKEGVSTDMPAAMVEKATWETEQIITGTLDTIVSQRDEMNITPPAVTIIGEVAKVRENVIQFMQEGLG